MKQTNFTYNRPLLKARRQELRKSQTDAEKFLWSRLKGNQFFGLRFFRQYSVGFFILDFYCPARRLCLEIDGGQHALAEGKEYDKERSNYLRQQEIKVLRFWNNEVIKNMEGVLERIREELDLKT
jgi:very-short-patch-repair endonuclease